MEKYARAITREIAGLPSTGVTAAASVHLGGGTPTVLSERILAGIIGELRGAVVIEPAAEVAVEANPGTLDRGKVRLLRELGVNRVTVGVQSLRNERLRFLGRRHTAGEALAALELLREEGFANIGIDLIYAIPGQTTEEWLEDLDRVAAFRPQHLSLYALTIEPGTPFGRRRRRGTLPAVPEEIEVALHLAARERLAAEGYGHYEISNWALPGFRSRHNLRYWTGGEYVGVGAAAHSFRGRPRPERWWNVSDPVRYVRRVMTGVSPVLRRELLPERVFLAEGVMTGLRLIDGIDRAGFRTTYGADPLERFAAELGPFREMGWLDWTPDRLGLTPQGLLLADEVAAALF